MATGNLGLTTLGIGQAIVKLSFVGGRFKINESKATALDIMLENSRGHSTRPLLHPPRLVHGNLKSSNVLLGPDFEACVVDYCLAALVVSDNDVPVPDPEAASSYKAPETRNSSHQATAKSDVYSYGVLLLELLTGKTPLQQPHLAPEEMVNWVRSVREDDVGDGDRLIYHVTSVGRQLPAS
ncbi:Leucine-rich repeat protein kinase family protein isoform 1 [Tripterygium wilfordii]|uniref:Leucine-rich repeat protein kinase family protein isoform 1 n=1 Tax=Tripterygium wilfordii TaxID=458696 RepID=A0A7J7D3L2_TRIWF|nr:Leucine-rich repeat protein kinase family protein isoform 1 [Tripterygium wilfordii]